MQKTKTEKKFLTRKDLAARWCCSTDTIRRKARRGEIKEYNMVSSHALYALEEVEAIEAKEEEGAAL